MNKLPYLNLGCGITYSNRWTNIDFVSANNEVIAHNLLKGIPCENNSFQVVYHSHVLEHFPKEKAIEFTRECYRVLKPGGIIRVAIPDLEQIAINYIKYLDEALNKKPGAIEKYEWTIIEMFDQMVRNKTGGEMLKYVSDKNKNNDSFIMERCGHEAQRMIEAVRKITDSNKLNSITKSNYISIFKRIQRKIKRKAVHLLLKDEYDLLEKARFREGGEIHQWMYDRYSLGILLKNSGFKDIAAKSAFESTIPGWNEFELDVKNGKARKPDSLFMEGVK